MNGGEFTFVRDWAHCAAEILTVQLIERNPDPATAADVSVPYVRSDFRTTNLRPSRIFHRLNRQLERSRLFIAATSHGQPDLFHSHFYSSCYSALPLVRKLGIPLIHTEHSSSIAGGTISKIGRETLLSVCRQASVVVAVSESLRDAMRLAGVTRDIEVLPNPVRITTPPEGSLRLARDSAGPVYVSVGWLNRNKDHASLLRAFALLKKHKPEASLVVIGSGDQLGTLRRHAKQLEIASSVTFAGRLTRSEVYSHLAKADVYVHTSHLETFGVSIVEAWSFGLPVVTFNCGGVSARAPEFSGALVDERSPTALARAMVEALESTSQTERERIALACAEHFGSKTVANRLREIYQSC